MTKFADAVEINSSAMSSVSGGNRNITLWQGATVGGIVDVIELAEFDAPPPPGIGMASYSTFYVAEVAGGRVVNISESQFDADVNQVHQSNNVSIDFTY